MRDESGRTRRRGARRSADAGRGSGGTPSAATDATGAPWPSRAALALAAGAAVLLVAAVAYVTPGGSDGRARLPPLPDLSAYTPAVREHLRARYAEAERADGSAATLGALCVAYHADMLYDEAEECYRLAAGIEPQEWRWPYGRALIAADRGGGDELVATLQQVVAHAPEFSPAWLRLGDAEFKAGRHDRAKAAWDRAARLPEPPRPAADPPHVVETPVVAYAVLGLARIARARGDVARAADLLEDVANGAPSFSPAFRLLADAYTALGRAADADRARAHATRLPPFAPYADPVVDALARESRNGTLLLRMASEADLSVNAAWSEYLTRRALQFDPENPEVVSKLARVLQTLGRSEEALPYFQRYHEMVPGDYEGVAQLGSVLSDLGRYSEAEPHLRRALVRLDDALTHYNLALLLARTERTAEAIASYETALERDPRHANARINLAAALARRGDLAGAARELERVLAQDPENALAHTNHGLVLAQQGQTARAVRAFEEALRIDPRLTPAAEALRTLRE